MRGKSPIATSTKDFACFVIDEIESNMISVICKKSISSILLLMLVKMYSLFKCLQLIPVAIIDTCIMLRSPGGIHVRFAGIYHKHYSNNLIPKNIRLL